MPWILGGIAGTILILGVASVLALGLIAAVRPRHRLLLPVQLQHEPGPPFATLTPLPTMTITCRPLSLPIAPTYTPWPTDTEFRN